LTIRKEEDNITYVNSVMNQEICNKFIFHEKFNTDLIE